MDNKIGGIAVHIGARVMAEARPGEVLVSSTVKDLVTGSGLRFIDRGKFNLKGIPGEWNLFTVEHCMLFEEPGKVNADSRFAESDL